jgi:hypothetical protein
MRKRSLMLVAATALAVLPLWTRAETLPNTIDDKEFWRLITDLSEPGGRFQQQFMSNEDSFQFVIPGLKANTQKNGVYIGVGSEQNFTYIAAIQPKVSFIIDIRRDNMIEHLIYKAIFELAPDRADFLSRLFSRKRPFALEANTTAKALFDAFQPMEPDPSMYEQNVRAVTDRLVAVHKFPLTDADKADVARILNAFRMAGPYSLKGTGDITNPTYAQLMAMTDPAGTNQSFLASEENFRIVQKLQRQNAVIPLTGDFAGERTLTSLGQYLKDHDAAVDVFYVSNVERYLFDDFAHGRQFYGNLARLPLKRASTFVRSVTTDISKRLGFPLPDGKEKWRTLLFSINDCLKGLADGRIQSYRDLFTAAK